MIPYIIIVITILSIKNLKSGPCAWQYVTFVCYRRMKLLFCEHAVIGFVNLPGTMV